MTNRELKEQILDALDYVRNMEGVVRDDKIVEDPVSMRNITFELES